MPFYIKTLNKHVCTQHVQHLRIIHDVCISCTRAKGGFVVAHSMAAADMKNLEENFRQQNKSCFILGASGESGKMLLQELLERNIFSKITLIGRRRLAFEDDAHENLVSGWILSSVDTN